MDVITSYIGILGVLLLGIMSPGPSFVLVARTSVAVSRTAGFTTAIGMGVGGAGFAIIALLGLQAVLLSVPVLYMALKILGGMYLIYLAIVIWRGAKQSIDNVCKNSASSYKSFKLGLITQLSNPKTAIFYGSVFAALLPPNLPISTILVLAPTIFFLETGWYSLVAFVLSSTAPRKTYLNLKIVLDRLASGIIGTLGLKLIHDARSA
ncbi:MAG: threonine transporter [SAR86 cluster bacterium]|uniref:Threonine transporter n=1 Tax=SAR86 cluster bacterium TaxID=2030880 RepID=A0A2A5B931_9GAMM|nr:MAG: threonine transporter [SAR86 cluster bacterium]